MRVKDGKPVTLTASLKVTVIMMSWFTAYVALALVDVTPVTVGATLSYARLNCVAAVFGLPAMSMQVALATSAVEVT